MLLFKLFHWRVICNNLYTKTRRQMNELSCEQSIKSFDWIIIEIYLSSNALLLVCIVFQTFFRNVIEWNIRTRWAKVVRWKKWSCEQSIKRFDWMIIKRKCHVDNRLNVSIEWQLKRCQMNNCFVLSWFNLWRVMK